MVSSLTCRCVSSWRADCNSFEALALRPKSADGMPIENISDIKTSTFHIDSVWSYRARSLKELIRALIKPAISVCHFGFCVFAYIVQLDHRSCSCAQAVDVWALQAGCACQSLFYTSETGAAIPKVGDASWSILFSDVLLGNRKQCAVSLCNSATQLYTKVKVNRGRCIWSVCMVALFVLQPGCQGRAQLPLDAFELTAGLAVVKQFTPGRA